MMAAHRMDHSCMSSEDSSDDEHLSYLLAATILPGFVPHTTTTRNGSRPGKSPNKRREFAGTMDRSLHDYFGSSPKYSTADFERRFRMSRSVFDRIYNGIEGRGIFVRRNEETKKPGIHSLQRIVGALCMLAYGQSADSLDEYLQRSEDSCLLSLKAFCTEVISVFGDEYLREPTEDDLLRIMSINAARGFPGCIGSIDCQHWEWKNCPLPWTGQFQGKEKKPTVVLEAISDGELWIWNCFFWQSWKFERHQCLGHVLYNAAYIGGPIYSKLPFHGEWNNADIIILSI